MKSKPDAAQHQQLDDAILQAHAADDGLLLAQLYEQAAEMKAAMGDENAAAFLYTQAYVFALENGSPQAVDLRGTLQALGRETAD